MMLAPALLANAAQAGTNITISFPTVTNFNYQVVYKTNLTDPIWIPVGGAVGGNNGIRSVIDPIGNATRFYRVQIQ
jgi:hypothetical protein